MDREAYMRMALSLAREASLAGEVPVGCVIADETGRVIGRGRNMREEKRSALSHAECEAIAEACAARGDWRLDGVTLYVTKEPCAMCAGALVNTRVDRVVYGMADPRSGCAGSALDITGFPGMLHQVRVTGGVLEEECRSVIRAFFARVRKR